MTDGRLLRQLIKTGARAGGEDFRRVAEDVIREQREHKHHLLANDLERILYGEAGLAGRPGTAHAEIPKDRERGLPLLEVRAPARDLGDIVLSPDNKGVLDDVIREQARSDLLASWGLRPIQRLLFCGPPGCGKTTAAEVLATELGRELAVVRFDAVVSSFLGETASNLRRVFDFLSSGTYVALFDEFDAIGKEREDATEHGELKRVVSAFLQMMDAFQGRSLLVAASNHERLLDRALWRRFDEIVLFAPPTDDALVKLIEMKVRGVRHDLVLDDPALLRRFSTMSHADVERVIVRAIKGMVLNGREFLTRDQLEEALSREGRRRSDLAFEIPVSAKRGPSGGAKRSSSSRPPKG